MRQAILESTRKNKVLISHCAAGAVYVDFALDFALARSAAPAAIATHSQVQPTCCN